MVLVKLAIVALAIYYIYQKVFFNEQLPFVQFSEQFKIVWANSFWMLLAALLFTDANWFVEFTKWKKLVSTMYIMSFYDACKQCLSSLTVSLLTPNRIGEYGAKALYFNSKDYKNIIVLNLVGNACQMAATVFFGVIGLIFLLLNFNEQLPDIKWFHVSIGIVGCFILLVIGFTLYLKNKKDIDELIPKGFLFSILNLSFLRYLIFAHQFLFLVYLFGIDINYFVALNLLFCMYILASIIPTLAIFDWVIKGSLAVWLFGLVGVNEVSILTITTLMWLLNVAIPAIIGSFFVLNFKLFSK